VHHEPLGEQIDNFVMAAVRTIVECTHMSGYNIMALAAPSFYVTS